MLSIHGVEDLFVSAGCTRHIRSQLCQVRVKVGLRFPLLADLVEIHLHFTSFNYLNLNNRERLDNHIGVALHWYVF